MIKVPYQENGGNTGGAGTKPLRKLQLPEAWRGKPSPELEVSNPLMAWLRNFRAVEPKKYRKRLHVSRAEPEAKPKHSPGIAARIVAGLAWVDPRIERGELPPRRKATVDAAATPFDQFHRAGTGDDLSRRDLDRATRTLDESDPVVNITNNPVRDQFRRALDRGKASKRAGSSRSGGILGRIEGIAAPAYISLPMRVFKRRLCRRNGNLRLFPGSRLTRCRGGAK